MYKNLTLPLIKQNKFSLTIARVAWEHKFRIYKVGGGIMHNFKYSTWDTGFGLQIGKFSIEIVLSKIKPYYKEVNNETNK